LVLYYCGIFWPGQQAGHDPIPCAEVTHILVLRLRYKSALFEGADLDHEGVMQWLRDKNHQPDQRLVEVMASPPLLVDQDPVSWWAGAEARAREWAADALENVEYAADDALPLVGVIRAGHGVDYTPRGVISARCGVDYTPRGVISARHGVDYTLSGVKCTLHDVDYTAHSVNCTRHSVD
jgi:hypothetical protein